jgi:hypothetical protein
MNDTRAGSAKGASEAQGQRRAMVEIQIRGGSFTPGTTCVFREDHFRFNEGIFSTARETIYIENAIKARVIDLQHTPLVSR